MELCEKSSLFKRKNENNQVELTNTSFTEQVGHLNLIKISQINVDEYDFTKLGLCEKSLNYCLGELQKEPHRNKSSLSLILTKFLSNQIIFENVLLKHIDNVFFVLRNCLQTFNGDLRDSIEESNSFVVACKVLQLLFQKTELRTFQQFTCMITTEVVSGMISILSTDLPGIEADNLKICLHELYRNFLKKRPKVREAFRLLLDTINYNGSLRPTGLEILFEILASIASGLNIPLKNEMLNFYNQQIIPTLRLYDFVNQERLTMIFIQKDPSLVRNVFKALIKYDTSINQRDYSCKFGLIVSIFMEVQNFEVYRDVSRLIIDYMVRVLKNSNRIKVLEFISRVVSSNEVISFLAYFKDEAFPLLIPVVCSLVSNKSINLDDLKNRLKMIDVELYEKFSQQTLPVRLSRDQILNKNKDKWDKYLENAKKSIPDIESMIKIPYSSSTRLKDAHKIYRDTMAKPVILY